MKKLLALALCTLPLALVQAQTFNTLSAKEKQEGWRLLFDGKTLNGWHTYNKKGIGSAWKINDDALMLDNPNRAGNKTVNGGDIVTGEVFSGDFEFKIDWKITPKANSGIFFFVQESPTYPEIFTTGMELQVTDNSIYGEGPDNNRRAGDLFHIVSARVREVKPVGEWNQVHLTMKKGLLSVYLNGFQIHEIRLNGEEWKKWIANSDLKTAPISQGKYAGRIGLQDWGSTSWYRNVKFRQLVN